MWSTPSVVHPAHPPQGYGEPVAEKFEDEAFTGEDWYGEEMADRSYTRCTFTDVDLTESSTRGTVFEECTFSNVRFNASRHSDSAFLRCTFARSNLFETEFTGCKLTGSTFTHCDLRPLTVEGGDWSFVGLAEADLRGTVFRRTRMREVDLTKAKLEKATLTDVDLSAAHLIGADLTGCDLRGSDLTALNPNEVRLAGAIIHADQAVVIAQALGFEVR